MSDRTIHGIRRRQLLAGAGVTVALSASDLGAVEEAAKVPAWDVTTDVLVAGSGAAGICAALEARRAGARVMLIESLPQFGGSSALSGGVVYAGGGTALQRALGVEDSEEEMYRFLSQAGGPHPQLDKIQLYCEESPAHFEEDLEILYYGSDEELVDKARHYVSNSSGADRARIRDAARARARSEHTWTHRFRSICDRLGLPFRVAARSR